MQYIGYKKIKLKSLSLPGNWKEICASEEVDQRAKSISELGIMHPPLVRKSDMALICGRRRVAAALKNGQSEIEVRLVDCDDLEAERLEVEENLERQHYQPGERRKLTARLVEICEKQEREKGRKPAGGRRKSARGYAREAVAARRGIKPESVRKAELRARQAQQRKMNPQQALQARLDLLGMEVDHEFLAKVAIVQHHITETISRLRAAESALGQLSRAEVPIHAAALEVLRDAVRDLKARVADAFPTMLCPACKGVEELLPKCASCTGTAWISKGQVDGVPEELLDPTNQKVQVKGKIRSLDDFLPADDAIDEMFGG